eukprot:556973-Pleurochrysis_carterae.AAC.1
MSLAVPKLSGPALFGAACLGRGVTTRGGRAVQAPLPNRRGSRERRLRVRLRPAGGPRHAGQEHATTGRVASWGC